MSIQNQYRPLLEAVSFASRVHQGHTRKDGRTPYASHVFRVCLVLHTVFGFTDPRMMIAALLHDTVEDTTTDYDDIAEIHGNEIAGWVAALTKNKMLPEAEREDEYIGRFMNAPWQVRACKLADIFDNLLDMPHVSEDKRQKSLKRIRQYLASLQRSPEPELKGPLETVAKLLKEMTGT